MARGYFGPDRVEWIKKHCVPVVGNRGNAVYMLSAGGKPLDNARKSPEYIGQTCDPQAALKEFNSLPEEDRRPKELKPLGLVKRPIAITPDILVLRVLHRPLERDAQGRIRRSTKFKGGFRGVNRDFVWLKESEWKPLVPANPVKGAVAALPEAVVLRLCRFYLSNCTCTAVCGNHVWTPAEVVEKDFKFVVEQVSAAGVTMRLTGHARMQAAKGGAEFRVGGTWHYDAKKQAFDRIEFAALGPFDNKITKDYYGSNMMGEEFSLLGIAFELAEPGSFGYGTPPAPFYYDAKGLDYFGTPAKP